jgi:hypothetical protein
MVVLLVNTKTALVAAPASFANLVLSVRSLVFLPAKIVPLVLPVPRMVPVRVTLAWKVRISLRQERVHVYSALLRLSPLQQDNLLVRLVVRLLSEMQQV